jgi:hypothetical protein
MRSRRRSWCQCKRRNRSPPLSEQGRGYLTRNHRYKNIEELLDSVLEWLAVTSQCPWGSAHSETGRARRNAGGAGEGGFADLGPLTDQDGQADDLTQDAKPIVQILPQTHPPTRGKSSANRQRCPRIAGHSRCARAAPNLPPRHLLANIFERLSGTPFSLAGERLG